MMNIMLRVKFNNLLKLLQKLENNQCNILFWYRITEEADYQEGNENRSKSRLKSLKAKIEPDYLSYFKENREAITKNT